MIKKLTLICLILISFIFSEKIDFREAILDHGMRISLNGKELDKYQQFIWSEDSYIIGIFYNGQWNETVIMRGRKRREIKNTPY